MSKWFSKFFKLVLFLWIISIFNCGLFHKTPIERSEYVSKKLISELDLDSSQEQVMIKIKNEWIEKFKQTQPSKNTIEEIVLIINSEKIEDAKLNKISDDMIKNRTEMFLFINAKFKELHAVLRPDQKKKLSKKFEQIMKKYGHDIQ